MAPIESRQEILTPASLGDAEQEATRIMEEHQRQIEEDTLFEDLTQFPGFDISSVESPSRDELRSMAKIVFDQGEGQSILSGAGDSCNAIAKVFSAASTVLRMVTSRDTQRPSDEHGVRPYHQPWFWIIVRRELCGSGNTQSINHDHLRQVVFFYAKGFHARLHDKELKVVPEDSMTPMLLAMLDWEMLTRNRKCSIQLISTNASNPRKRRRTGDAVEDNVPSGTTSRERSTRQTSETLNEDSPTTLEELYDKARQKCALQEKEIKALRTTQASRATALTALLESQLGKNFSTGAAPLHIGSRTSLRHYVDLLEDVAKLGQLEVKPDTLMRSLRSLARALQTESAYHNLDLYQRMQKLADKLDHERPDTV